MNLCKKITDSKIFETSIIALIIFNAMLMGLETSENIAAAYSSQIFILNWVIQGVFVVEIGIRILSYQPKIGLFFKNGWNVYDFIVVSLACLPLAGNFVNIARLARVLRITRLIGYFPELRLIVSTMLRSIPSMTHVIVLLSLLLYVYAIIGFHLFSKIDPENWGNLGLIFITLFQVITLENWPDIQEQVSSAGPFVWLYFMSYIVIAVFIVMNLFVAIVINNLETVKSENLLSAAEEHTEQELLGLIEGARKKLDQIESFINRPKF